MKPTLAALVLLLLLLLAGGCGDAPGPDRAPGEAPRADVLPELPAVSADAKARFALDRLLRGPLRRTGAFVIPKIHLLNLEHARADLAALGDTTRALLSDPELVERVTRADGDHNPWHNVLQVLPWLDDLSVDLVVTWCRPVLATHDLQLHRRALRALLAVEDGQQLAPLLLQLLERRPRDRELAPSALHALLRLGDPWRKRALDLALRNGSPLLWRRVPGELRAATDALTWWAVLAECAGPVEVPGTSRSIAAPWYQGRLMVDDAAWPREPAQLEAAVQAGRLLAPAQVIDAAGYLPRPEEDSAVLSWRQVLLSGRASAAEARCSLAQAGYPAYRATVRRDLAATDPRLVWTAEGCAVGSGDPAEAAELDQIVLGSFLEDLEAGAQPSPTSVARALRGVFQRDPGAGVEAAVRILRSARPQDAYRALIESAHDFLAAAAADTLTAELTALLLHGDDPEDRATGLLLVRRGRNPRHATLLDALLDGAAPDDVGLLHRLLIWLHTAPGPEDPAARRAFVERYVQWLDSAPDEEAGGLATGLLDFGAPGAAAYAAGLSGPRRALFVQGLLGRSGLVPLEVADALLRPVDATTSPAERRAVLIAAYRTAPAAAATRVAALRERLAPGARSEADDVLEVVHHRADRTP